MGFIFLTTEMVHLVVQLTFPGNGAYKAMHQSIAPRVASGRECYARETLRRKAVESLQVVFRSSLRRPLFTFLIKNLKI